MKHDTADSPLTENRVVKLIGIGAGVTAVISIVWFCASLKGDVASLKQEDTTIRREIETRNTEQDREIEKLKTHAAEIDRAIADINRKLDVCVAILERVEKKVSVTSTTALVP